MYRTTLANAALKRTCTPLHEKHQATPFATFIDPAETSTSIYSGMVAAKTGPDVVSVCDGATVAPFGLFALDRNAGINDLDGMDMEIFAVWIGGPDAYFTIDAPAFDDTQTYAVGTAGVRVPLYAGTGGAKGKLTSASPGGNARAVAELVQVVNASRIIVRLDSPPALGGTIV